MASSSPLAGRRVLLGVTGGIAAYKACDLARLLVGSGALVQAVMTETATRFVGPDTLATLTGRPVGSSLWQRPGDVIHVRLAHEADVAVVAPATANVIAKIASGLADDLLTSTLLESRCPLILAPAMHSGMWEHSATQANVRVLVERGVLLVGPVAGALAAGDEGPGRMAEPGDILAAVEGCMAAGRDLAGSRIVVTAGPTWEPLDPVRYIGNRSSGKMGFAVAREAYARGAAVTLIAGPSTAAPPPGPGLVRVETAEEMREAVEAAWVNADALVMAAAVADFRPRASSPQKLKKDSGVPAVDLVATTDILAELPRDGTRRVLVGFAAETGDLEAAGRGKLQRKALDLIVVNEVGREGTGFGADTNDAMLLSRDGDDEPLRTWTKQELASDICDRLAKLLGR